MLIDYFYKKTPNLLSSGEVEKRKLEISRRESSFVRNDKKAIFSPFIVTDPSNAIKWINHSI